MTGRRIPDRLLPNRVTIRKPVQSFVPGSRRPVFEYRVSATGVKARFNPVSAAMNQTVMGQAARNTFKLFLNPADLKKNDEIVNETTGAVFIATEVKDLFGHLEVVLQSREIA